MEAPKDDADDAQHRDNRHKDVHAALPSKLNPSTATTIAARFKKVSPATASLSLHSTPPWRWSSWRDHDKGAFTQRHSSAKSPLPELKICRFECICPLEFHEHCHFHDGCVHQAVPCLFLCFALLRRERERAAA